MTKINLIYSNEIDRVRDALVSFGYNTTLSDYKDYDESISMTNYFSDLLEYDYIIINIDDIEDVDFFSAMLLGFFIAKRKKDQKIFTYSNNGINTNPFVSLALDDHFLSEVGLVFFFKSEAQKNEISKNI